MKPKVTPNALNLNINWALVCIQPVLTPERTKSLSTEENLSRGMQILYVSGPSWAAKRGNQSCRYKDEKKECSTQFCVQDVEDVTDVLENCSPTVICTVVSSNLSLLVSVSRQAPWQPSRVSIQASASSRWTASMWARRATPASSLMSPPAGSTDGLPRWAGKWWRTRHRQALVWLCDPRKWNERVLLCNFVWIHAHLVFSWPKHRVTNGAGDWSDSPEGKGH